LIAHRNKEYAEGMHIIPVLTMANIFIGIYYNLSIWYKLTNRTMSGAVITLVGVGITVILNILLVPLFHYTGASWATFACYLSMLVITYVWGKKHYPVPYDVKKLLMYLGLVYGMFLIKQYIFDMYHFSGFIAGMSSFIISALLFIAVVLKVDKKEMKALPVIGKMLS
jgi:O-antigen/teichoic acid export membrane protein